MRISDWSSDVCSSDLANSLALVQDGQDNQASLTQNGDGNMMSATQTGDANRLAWTQDGNGLSDLQIQQSGGSTLQIQQTGAQGGGGQKDGCNERSEERSVGKACVSTVRSGCSPAHQKTKQRYVRIML